MIVDTHAHLTDSQFATDLGEVLERAHEVGVNRVITIASDLADSEATVALAANHAEVYATVGVHPHSAEQWSPESRRRIESLAAGQNVVAIGETGLDFFYDTAPRDLQKKVFAEHLELGRQFDLPVVVHAREADEDVAAIILEAGWSKGVLHCFSSGVDLMEMALDLGWHISFSGMITFKKWTQTDVLRAVPAARLLIETDSPYLAPVPNRGKRNEPAYVREVLLHAAGIRGEDPADLAAQTTANALAFYDITE